MLVSRADDNRQVNRERHSRAEAVIEGHGMPQLPIGSPGVWARLGPGERCRTAADAISFGSMKSDVICRSADVMGCAPVFCGTRVPVQALLDYLAVGDTIDEFLVGFPAVTHEQVVELL
ncbi:MAG TPA: DUF433 domain-containing protein [Stellaceae bacterium]|nr:DUF433 domain-containing protein [Stellaceae bacterium]